MTENIKTGFELIIWDCDGCLVDSEFLACRVGASLLTEAGFPMTPEEFVARFAGCSWPTIREKLVAEKGVDFLEKFSWQDVRDACDQIFPAQLKPIDGVADVLKRLSVPMCIASGSEAPRIANSLRITGLSSYFDSDHIFSSHQVARGKPAPDVFLFAAEKMGVSPEKCLVIEDSHHGIAAAKAAGMTVFAFLGASHVSDAWRTRIHDTGVATIFADMRELPRLLQGAKPER